MSTSDSLKLGELLIQEGYLSPEDLKKMLEEQRVLQSIPDVHKPYKPLGQMCIERRFLSPEELQKVLKKHHKHILLGELLINMSFITAAQLEEALKTQKKSLGMKLGELLVEAEALSEHHLVEALSIQLDIPRVFPALELIDPPFIELFGLRYLEEEHCLPMHRDARVP